ncbi:chaperonin 10-like protein [Boletus edulis]|uniref:Chaperonin 10-like protein n=1 Tax=Boletus edulis BED1 TaxID=1328754 RepID=A0AAD4GBC8_BOLED|nr:chaperonin 10-like protein [Boletus edulis]KAF8434329.1 chaperonin 10-like protein [Boletus edulis BED1]
MSTSRALFLKEKFGAFEVGTKAIPTPGPGEILVKEVAVGLNPVDWKIQAYGIFVSEFPAILGSDAAGEVEAVGEGVTQFKKGDKVFHSGSLLGGSEYATFQEYVAVPADVVHKLPANITFEQAASLPLGIGTTVVPLYSPSPVGVGLKALWDGGRGHYAGQPALIFGGASSVGQYAIQFAQLSGFSPIITTASLRNADLLKSIGATHVIDRNTSVSSFPSEIARITTKPISLVYDAVGAAETQQLGYDTLAEGGHIVIVLQSSIKETSGSTKKVVGVFGNVQVPNNRALGRALAQNLSALLEAGDIIPNPVEVVPGGLNGIVPGLEKMRNNLVSGKKLVVRLSETA